MQSGRGAGGQAAGTTRAVRTALLCAASALAICRPAPVGAQSFTAAPVVFAPSGSNTVQVQPVSITLAAASTIRGISIPIGFTGTTEFTLVDQGGCTEDGVTLNPAGTVCNLVVRFRPAAAGLRTANLLVTDGSGNATAVGISGVGYYAQVAISPAEAKIVTGLGPSLAGLAGNGGIATSAELNRPQGIAVDSSGNVYVADTGNHVVRMLDAFGNITTVAGGGTSVGAAAEGGAATGARFTTISYLATDPAGNLYISDDTSNVVWRVAMSTDRTIRALAGNFTQGFSGDGGSGRAAQLYSPQGLVADGAGNLYIADSQNQRIRRVDVSGNITTFAGSGSYGFDAGTVTAANARFGSPTGLAMDLAGNLYLSDALNHAVREISSGTVTVVAGIGTASGSGGDGGLATAATLVRPAGIAVSPGGDLYIADAGANVVRKVQASDGVIETVVGDPSLGGSYTGGVTLSTNLGLNAPIGLAFDGQSNLYLVDDGNSSVRQLTASPGELAFASVASGSTSNPQVLRIGNIGNAPLSLVSVAAANATTAGSFVLSNSSTRPCGSSVAAGSHCEYAVAFAPTAGGFIGGEIDVIHVANTTTLSMTEPVYLFGGTQSPITIGPASLSPLFVGQAYSASIAAAGGFGAVTVTTSGSLPPGIAAAISGSTVTLSGTTTSSDPFSFTVNATDILADSATQTYTLQAHPAPVSYSLTESIRVTDAPAELPVLTYALTEAIHVTDSVVQLPRLTYALAEVIHVTDAVAQLPMLKYALAEAIHVTDAVAELPVLTYALAEIIHVTDSVAQLPTLRYALAETVHVTDSVAELPALLYALAETIHVTDSVTQLPTLRYALSETVHVTDSVAELPALLYALAETIHVTDSVTQLPTLRYALSETVHVTDNVAELPALLYALAETIHVTDSVTQLPTLRYALTETVHVTDNVAELPALLYALAETIHVTDSVAELPVLAYALLETVHVTDSVGQLPVLRYALAETVHVADSVANLPMLTYALAEAIHVTDSVLQLPTLKYALAELVHVTDSVVELPMLTYALSEAVHVSDSLQESTDTLALSPAAGALPAGVVNSAYVGATISATGGRGTVSAIVTGGVPGLTLGSAGGVVTVTGTPTSAGLYGLTILASDSSGSTVSQTYTLTVGLQAQTITAATISGHVYGDAAFTPTATSSSGLAVTVSVVSGPATVTGRVVDMNGAGVVVLSFSQSGDANTSPATSIRQSFTVSPAPASILATSTVRAFETLNPLFASTTTGLVRGDTVATLGIAPALTTTAVLNSPSGSYPIAAAQPGLAAANYTFSFVSGTLTVSGHNAQTILFNKIPTVPVSAGTLTLTAHSTSALTVTYSVTGPASLSGTKLTLTGAGTVTVTASQAGNATFDPAIPAVRSFTVTP